MAVEVAPHECIAVLMVNHLLLKLLIFGHAEAAIANTNDDEQNGQAEHQYVV